MVRSYSVYDRYNDLVNGVDNQLIPAGHHPVENMGKPNEYHTSYMKASMGKYLAQSRVLAGKLMYKWRMFHCEDVCIPEGS